MRNGIFKIQANIFTGNNSSPSAVMVADLNRDKRLDIVIANHGTDNMGVFFRYGDGTFLSQINYATGSDSDPKSVVIGDSNNDRLGNGTFSSETTYFTGLDSDPYSVVVSDFDNDNQLDIAVASYGTNNVGILFGNGNGRFSNLMSFTSGFGARLFAPAVGDVNQDNLNDIMIVNNEYGNIDIISKTY